MFCITNTGYRFWPRMPPLAAFGRRDGGAPGKPEIKTIHCQHLDAENYAALGFAQNKKGAGS
jgi:hypothetical protein